MTKTINIDIRQPHILRPAKPETFNTLSINAYHSNLFRRSFNTFYHRNFTFLAAVSYTISNCTAYNHSYLRNRNVLIASFFFALYPPNLTVNETPSLRQQPKCIFTYCPLKSIRGLIEEVSNRSLQKTCKTACFFQNCQRSPISIFPEPGKSQMA